MATAEPAITDNGFLALVARAKSLSVSGRFEQARDLVRQLAEHHPISRLPPRWYRDLLVASVLARATDFTTRLLAGRYAAPCHFTIDIGETGAPPAVVMFRLRDGDARFLLDPALLSAPNHDMLLSRWADIVPLFTAFMGSPDRTDGGVAINLGDAASLPGLAFCDFRPGVFLIPDAIYMARQRYTALSRYFREHAVPWAERLPIGFWRGASTGLGKPPEGSGATVWWGAAQRILLCEIARAHPDELDAAITNVVQVANPTFADWLRARDMLRGHVPPESFQRYRYQIDIDGNSASWPGLFIKLLTGSPVLKVQSRKGFRQWYYDRLEPWTNFVPVAADLGDLIDKVTWLREHDDAARRIGEAGRGLADSLTDEAEIGRAAPIIAAAIRAAAKAAD